MPFSYSILHSWGRAVARVPAKAYPFGPQTIILPGGGPIPTTGAYLIRLTLGGQAYTVRVLMP